MRTKVFDEIQKKRTRIREFKSGRYVHFLTSTFDAEPKKFAQKWTLFFLHFLQQKAASGYGFFQSENSVHQTAKGQ